VTSTQEAHQLLRCMSSHSSGPNREIMCNPCSMYYRKYGRMRPVEVAQAYTFKRRKPQKDKASSASAAQRSSSKRSKRTTTRPPSSGHEDECSKRIPLAKCAEHEACETPLTLQPSPMPHKTAVTVPPTMSTTEDAQWIPQPTINQDTMDFLQATESLLDLALLSVGLTDRGRFPRFLDGDAPAVAKLADLLLATRSIRQTGSPDTYHHLRTMAKMVSWATARANDCSQ
jgi:hypothetical protein